MKYRREFVELERLCNALEEERITDAECGRLRELLLSSPAIREEYIRITEVSVGLRTYAAYAGRNDLCRPTNTKIIVYFFAAAAAVAIAALGLMRTRVAPATPAASGFASITWVDGATYVGLEAGSRIGKGVLELAPGQQVGISVDGGTTLLLAGPAHLDLLSPGAAYLHEGRAKIRLNGKGRTFSLETDEFRLLDLGTEFGVWADPDKPDEAHVIEGSVEIRGTGKPRVLKAGEGLSGTGGAVEYRPGLFYFGKSRGEAKPTGRDLARLSSAKLKHDSRLVVHFPMEETSGASLKNESARSNAPAEAVISGAKWVAGRFPGKPALSFSAPGDAVRLDIPGEFEAITLCAWVRVASLPNFYNAIFNSDNFEPGNIHWQVEGTGGLNLGVSWSPGIWEGLYSRHPVTGNTPSGWIHLATTFDRLSGKCIHYLDGNPIVEVTAKQIPGRKIRIGKASLGNWFYPQQGDEHPARPWIGEIDSFMFFGAALGADEIEKIYRVSSIPPGIEKPTPLRK